MIAGSLLRCGELDLIEPIGFEFYEETDSIVFAVIGDYGKSGNPELEVSNLVKSWNPDFIITTGDNNYENGELKTIIKNISNYYGDYIYNYDAPTIYQCNGRAFEDGINRFFPSPGNHDADNKDNLIPYLNYFTLPGNEEYYKFVWGPVSFFSLNSVTGYIEKQKAWLFEQLSQSVTPYNIVYFHHPPFTTGSHGNNKKMQWNYYDHNVDVVLSGHDHIYSRIEKKEEQKMYYIINGLGGKSLHNCKPDQLPAGTFETFCYNKDYGAIKGTANYNKLVLKFYSISQQHTSVDSIVIHY